jgi:hypothetical protein
MASAPKTLQDLQDRIHLLYENDPNTPATTDDEWTIRLGLINQMIEDWGLSEDVLWNELFRTYTHGSAIVAGTTAYPLSITSMRFPGSQVKFTDANGNWLFLSVIEPYATTNFYDNTRQCFFTGDPGNGYTLNLAFSPLANDGITGLTPSFKYYKFPNLLSATTDKPEMGDTGFITYGVAAYKHLMDGNSNQYSVFDGKSTFAMDNMKIRNEMLPPNSDMRMDDVDLIRNNSYFGG